MSSLRSYLFHEQRGKCHYCNVTMTMKTTGKYHCTVDHKVPKSWGGSDLIGNLVGACFTCNNMRGTIQYWAFKMYITIYGNKRTIKEVLRAVTREEYIAQQKMWDAIHGFRQKPEAMININVRRPCLVDIRKFLEPTVLSFGAKQRNMIYMDYLKGHRV